MVIYPVVKKSTKHRTSKSAKQSRENKANWEALLSKWDIKPKSKVTTKSQYRLEPKRGGSLKDAIKSVDTGFHDVTIKQHKQYTGDSMIGVATLHKSNGIPVFRQEDAIDISKMRRG